MNNKHYCKCGWQGKEPDAICENFGRFMAGEKVPIFKCPDCKSTDLDSDVERMARKMGKAARESMDKLFKEVMDQ